jgi:hypothetical protein
MLPHQRHLLHQHRRTRVAHSMLRQLEGGRHPPLRAFVGQAESVPLALEYHESGGPVGLVEPVDGWGQWVWMVLAWSCTYAHMVRRMAHSPAHGAQPAPSAPSAADFDWHEHALRCAPLVAATRARAEELAATGGQVVAAVRPTAAPAPPKGRRPAAEPASTAGAADVYEGGRWEEFCESPLPQRTRTASRQRPQRLCARGVAPPTPPPPPRTNPNP